MAMPNDPIMLLSYVNTKLRDEYNSLEELCKSRGADENELKAKIFSVGYEYDRALNRFV